MIVRIWRGWAAEDNAGEIAAHLRAETLARFAECEGFVSAQLLERPLAGGVEILTLTTWRSAGDVPAGVDEAHRLLVARETVAGCWSVVDPPVAVVRAA